MKNSFGFQLTISRKSPQQVLREARNASLSSLTTEYNALKRESVPITFYNGGTISKYLNGEGKVGIVPCFDSPSDYFYGGFADKDVGEFINLPDEKYNDLIHKAQWEPLVEVRLKGKDM